MRLNVAAATLRSQLVKTVYCRASQVLYQCATTSNSQLPLKAVETRINKKLAEHFEPQFLKVINESHLHCVEEGAETHFKVVIVSSKFINLSLLQCHRQVHNVLRDEVHTGVHALSIIAKTPTEWNASNKTICSSPSCRGGSL